MSITEVSMNQTRARHVQKLCSILVKLQLGSVSGILIAAQAPCCTEGCFYLLLHEDPPHMLVLYMSWPLTISTQTEQALIVEIMLLIVMSEFTSHQFCSGNSLGPTCCSRSPLLPKLPPQLIKLSLLGLGYLQLLVQVTKTLVTLPAPWPSLQYQQVVRVSVIHMILQQQLHHNTKKCVYFLSFAP